MEPRTKLAPQRRLPHIEGPHQTHPVSAAAGRRGTGGAIEGRDREGACQWRSEETDRASRPAWGSVRAEYATRRAAHEQKDGGRRPRAGERSGSSQVAAREEVRRVGRRTKDSLEPLGPCG